MRRYGIMLAALALAGLAAAILSGTIFMPQPATSAGTGTGLVLQQKFPNHNTWVYTADFDEKDEFVASGGEDGLRVWRVDNAREVYHRTGRIFLARFLKGDNFLCADSNEGVLLLDAQTWQVRKKFGQPAVTIVAAVSDAGDKIAASFSVVEVDQTKPPNSRTKPPLSFQIYVWQYIEKEWRESILRGHQGPVNAIAFHPDAPHLVSSGEDLTTRIWDLSTSKQIDQIGEGSPLTFDHEVLEWHSACMFSASGDRFVTNSGTYEYDKNDNSPIRKSTVKKVGGRCGMFSADGRWIATGHKDGTLRLWDGKSFIERIVVKGSINGSPLNEVRFSPSGKLIVTTGMGIVPLFSAMEKKVKSNDTVVRVWRVNVPE
ncbi:MAG: WD40 repeat domain-containing protein [Pirellulaceae bacterium]